MKLFFSLVLVAFLTGALADPECTPEITKFQVFDSAIDAPVGDSIIDSDNVHVCLPESGMVSIEAIATPCVEDDVYLQLTRPSGRTFTKRERIAPYTLYGNRGNDYFGRHNFGTGKDFIIAAGFEETAGSLAYVFQFKECESDPFDISLDLVEVPPSDEPFFTEAKSRWESVITNGLVDFLTYGFSPPIIPGCTYPVIVDDVYMCAGYQYIDGPDGTLGFAGPHFVNTETGLPFTGFMVFETEDAKTYNAYMAAIIMHEMGHVLGIGTLWELNGVTGADVDDCPYYGSKANAEYANISGCPIVPTELDGEKGTRCGHFDEVCMVDELMTGYLSGSTQPLSKITIGSLEDLGYSVDYSVADPFGSGDLGTCPSCGTRRLSVLDYAHGETRQLGLRRTKQRRQLSKTLRQTAIKEGLAFLQKNAVMTASTAPEGFEYIGDKVVSVVITEGNSFFSVIVKNE